MALSEYFISSRNEVESVLCDETVTCLDAYDISKKFGGAINECPAGQEATIKEAASTVPNFPLLVYIIRNSIPKSVNFPKVNISASIEQIPKARKK